MSEDSGVLPSSAEREPAENGPGSSLPMEKKDEFWAGSASWSSSDGSTGWKRGGLAILHPREEGAGCDRRLRVFMLVRKWLKTPHCMNLLFAGGGKGRGGGEVNPSTCFPCPDRAAASRGVARRRMSQKRGRLRKV